MLENQPLTFAIHRDNHRMYYPVYVTHDCHITFANDQMGFKSMAGGCPNYYSAPTITVVLQNATLSMALMIPPEDTDASVSVRQIKA